MISKNRSKKLPNFLLVALLTIILIFTAFHEGFLSLISVLFWVVLIAGILITVWLAWSSSTSRVLSLLLGIFIIEYIKEAIGIRSQLWTYNGIGKQFNFGVWAWVLGGLVVYTLATKVTIPLIKKLHWSPPKWLNPVILIILAALIPLTLGAYWSGTGCLFWAFYILLTLVCIYASLKMDFSVVIGIVITAWIISNPSEYVGSINSGVWTFTHNPHYPPFFLLFGCWPLETLTQYFLSAFLANESLD